LELQAELRDQAEEAEADHQEDSLLNLPDLQEHPTPLLRSAGTPRSSTTK